MANIKADQTIVASARGAAMAGVPFSYEGKFDSFLEEYGKLMDDFGKNSKKIIEGLEGVHGEIKDSLSSFKQAILDDDIVGDRDTLMKEIKGYRDELKKLPIGPKGREKREELLKKINKRIKTVEREGADIGYTIGAYDANLVSPDMMPDNPEDFIMFNNLAKYHSGVDLAEKPVDLIPTPDVDESTDPVDKNLVDPSFKVYQEGGKTMYEMEIDGKKVKRTIAQLRMSIANAIPDRSAVVDANELMESMVNSGKEAANNPKLDFNSSKQRHKTKLLDIFKDTERPNAFKSIITHSLYNQSTSYKKSFGEEGSATSLLAMSTLFDQYPEADTDKSGELSLEEAQNFLKVDNYTNLVKALTDPTYEGFNKEIAYNLAAEVLVESDDVGRAAFGYGEALKYKENPTDADDEATSLPFSNNQVFKGGVTGGTLNNIWSMFNDGEITLDDGKYEVDDKTNTWTNQKTGTQKSGDEMLDIWQGNAGEFILKGDVRFKNFRGSMKGGESEDIKLPENLWGGTVTETGGVNMLKKQFPKLKNKFREGNMLSNYVINFNGDNYDLETPGDEAKLLEAIQEYIALQP